jgi:hypothetical protein
MKVAIGIPMLLCETAAAITSARGSALRMPPATTLSIAL